MRMKHIALLALVVLLAAILLGLLPVPTHRQEHDAPRAASADQMESEDLQPLFPAFSADSVSAVSIVTPQTAFDLRREKESMVSINGQHGDHEIFATLLEQIASIRMTPIEPFSAHSAPLLTLVIFQQDTQQSAAFYADQSSDELTRVIVKCGGVSAHGTTDGWRIGTLMLACEGVRIQDESGNEMPYQ